MRSETRSHIVFLVILIAAYLLLVPGVHGIFLLDDIPNLRPLELVTNPADPLQIAGFALSGGTGPMGRPLAMLSFGLQASDWPASPEAFKRINLYLHLLNGALLYAFLFRLGILSGRQGKTAAGLAFFTSALWLLHPLNLSTVFYAIQRMTELSATFMLLGLLVYLQGRNLLANGKQARGLAWMTIGALGGTALATLSKESGALLPLYILVLEVTLLTGLPGSTVWGRWAQLVIGLPGLMLLGYVGFFHQDWLLGGYQLRSFTLPERLMSETRALWTYVATIFFPQSAGLGLFHDDFAASRSLLAPPTTLAAIIGLATAVATAFLFRKRYPVFTFGVFWFLAGHVIESSVIPLELYFEHRNYFPMTGLIYAAVLGARHVAASPGLTLPKSFWAAAGGASLMVVSFVSWQQAQIWGNPVQQALQWSTDHPDSPRAQHTVAGVFAWAGLTKDAVKIFRQQAESDGGNPGGYVMWLSAGCQHTELPLPERDKLLEAFRFSHHVSHGVVDVLNSIVTAQEDGGCPIVDRAFLDQAMESLLTNPAYASYRHGLLMLLGRSAASQKKTDEALHYFDRALALSPNVEVALLKVKALTSAKRYGDATDALARASEINRGHFSGLKMRAYAEDIRQWENAIALAPH